MVDKMEKKRTLKKAPIEQALIAVLVEPTQDFASLKQLPDLLQDKYPLSEPFYSKSVFIDAFNGDVKSQQGTHEGYNLFSQDRKKHISISTSNVVISDSAKYENGEHLITQYKEIWNAYTKHNKPEQLKRVGLRYINKFSMTISDADENLLIKPVINSKDDTLLLSGLSGQYAVRSDFYRANGNIAIAILPHPDDKLEITFDIDVFDQDITYVDFSSIEDTLNRLRNFKNKLFFDNILDATERFN